MDEMTVLSMSFCPVIHAATFIDYLEVVIDSEGIVTYAVPSHMERLLSEYMRQRGICDRDACLDSLPMTAGIEDLCAETDCIAVWTHGIIGVPNARQRRILRRLKVAGLFKGKC